MDGRYNHMRRCYLRHLRIFCGELYAIFTAADPDKNDLGLWSRNSIAIAVWRVRRSDYLGYLAFRRRARIRSSSSKPRIGDVGTKHCLQDIFRHVLRFQLCSGVCTKYRYVYQASHRFFSDVHCVVAVYLVFRFVTGWCGAAFLSVAGGSVSDLFPKDKVAT